MRIHSVAMCARTLMMISVALPLAACASARPREGEVARPRCSEIPIEPLEEAEAMRGVAAFLERADRVYSLNDRCEGGHRVVLHDEDGSFEVQSPALESCSVFGLGPDEEEGLSVTISDCDSGEARLEPTEVYSADHAHVVSDYFSLFIDRADCERACRGERSH